MTHVAGIAAPAPVRQEGPPLRSLRLLKGAHQGARAAVILGGPSLVAQRFDVAALRRQGCVLFLETKALTPYFLSFGVQPDYWLLPFPEKAKDNALQTFIFRSFLAGVDIGPFLKREHAGVLSDLRTHFDDYLEPWRPERGVHKRYRWKPDVRLQDSPLDLIRRLPETRIIANGDLLARDPAALALPNPVYVYRQERTEGPFRLDEYYAPLEQEGQVVLRYNAFLNSAAIALYPLLHYLGFREVFLLGMDMSMLGSLEYAAPYTFRSMLHFRWFFSRTRRAFNADFWPNRPYYLRPRSEFDDAARLLAHDAGTRFVRVYSPWKYAAHTPDIPTMSMEDFQRQEPRA